MTTFSGFLARGASRVAETFLALDAFPDLAFGGSLPRRPTDLLLRPCEVMTARCRRRNPGPPGWRRREVRRWQMHSPGPGPTAPVRRTPHLLMAVAAVWNEDDVIFATVRHLFDQGVDRVFVIDDQSDDDTVTEARAAGATVIERPSDGRYSEAERYRSVQQLIERETTAAGGDVWWLIVDADEFPRGANGRTVREHVEELPGWVDVVGSQVLDHVPSSSSRYRRRDHPILSFPLARWYDNPYCRLGHWKHQLLRVRTGDDLLPLPGHHVVRSKDGRRVREPAGSLLMHHFPLRGQARTAEKFAKAAGPTGRYALSPDRFTRIRLRQRSAALAAYYADQPDLVPNTFPGQRRRGPGPRPWTELVHPAERAWTKIQRSSRSAFDEGQAGSAPANSLPDG